MVSVLTDLQNRGVKDILIACVGGLKGGMSWYDYTPLLFSEKGYMFGNILYGHWSLHQGRFSYKNSRYFALSVYVSAIPEA